MKIFKAEKHIPNRTLTASRKHFSGDCASHGHAFFEIEYVLNGSGVYVVNGQEYDICPGMLVFLSPAGIHAVRNAEMELFNIMFEYESVQALPTLDTTVLFLREEDRGLLTAFFGELTAHQNCDRPYALSLLQCVLHKLSSLADTVGATFPPYTQRAILFMLGHFQKGITLEETARHLGLSKAYFSDLFLRETGQNFKSYLDELRFSYAENLLMLTDLPVGEIFALAGFADYANFARRFKLRSGLTPTEYRAQNAEKY